MDGDQFIGLWLKRQNKETWKWFIQALLEDLSIVNEEQYVIMSDKQKGLESALHELLPRIEHRNCVQHIYRNFKRHHGSQLLRDKLWTCARASTESRYNAAMFDLKEIDPTAQTWMETNVGMPKHSCRAFFPLHVKSDMLCNNLSESFNLFILSARDKSIIAMLERIRRLYMERIKDRRLAIGTKSGPLCPSISKLIDKTICFVDGMSYVWNGLDGYEVFCVSGERFKVDLRKRECSCRLWQLTGISCIHAIPPIYSRKQLLADWVDTCYKVDTFGWLYENVLEPMTGPSEWPETNNITILPPKYHRQARRPKLSIKKDITEIQKVKGKDKLTRWNSQTCKYCGVQGHNVRTCPKKKAEREASGAGHPKKCTTTNKEQFPSTLERIGRA
ncbi:hypothetical protein LIER_38947 [Lithospermum erythrorhizon]|uniref:SWIM-type domain-containing protein n=1 Tax=Lithospermum erythrorhizon TaxID=34254 RepID=A0AAV3Q7B7_LITER